MVPPGGWHFPIGPGITITAGSYKELADKIFAYRLQHGIPEGNIEREIDRYVCSRWPHTCQMEPVDYGIPAQPEKQADILTRVSRVTSRMIAAMPQGGYQLVNQTEAERRAEICAKCPLNTAWRGGCGSCTANIATLGVTIRKHRNTKFDASLKACSQTAADLQMLVHLPESALPVAPEMTPPPNCWRGKTS